MSVPHTPSRMRTNWWLTGIEIGLVLSVAGIVFLHLNPLWHLNETGLLDPHVYWWNAAATIMTGTGLVMLALALVGSAAALVSRCFASRPLWPFVMAGLAVVGVVAWAGAQGFTHDFDARFEWNSGDGFKLFQLQGTDPLPSPPAASWVWTSLIGLQIQPQLQGYFHLIDWQRVNGHIGVEIVRIVPIAWPVGLGKDGESLDDPDETPLMDAAEKGDLQVVQQLLAAKPDVNARDQSGQTALIRACRGGRASPELIKSLLAAGADPNIRSRNDYSALAWATSHSDKAVMQMLRRAGAKP
jgi:hypothetical protein